jgi:hypothetical protein
MKALYRRAGVVVGFVVLTSVLWLVSVDVWRTVVTQEPGITVENFERIELGMTHDEVARILGSRGVEVSRMAVDGSWTIDYLWLTIRALPCSPPTPCVVQIIVSFSAGRVVGKSQSGLVDISHTRSNEPLRPTSGAAALSEFEAARTAACSWWEQT